METLYFIFGSQPSNLYYEWDGKTELDASFLDDGVLYCYDPKTTTPGELLGEYDGWGGFAEITKEEYEHFSKLEDSNSIPKY